MFIYSVFIPKNEIRGINVTLIACFSSLQKSHVFNIYFIMELPFIHRLTSISIELLSEDLLSTSKCSLIIITPVNVRSKIFIFSLILFNFTARAREHFQYPMRSGLDRIQSSITSGYIVYVYLYNTYITQTGTACDSKAYQVRALA